MSDAITRKEAYLKSIGDGTSSALKPITREEQYLAYIAGESKSFPTTPITREEAFLDKIAKSGVSGGSSINVQPLTVTENGTYDAPEGQAYDPVIVNVAGGGGTSARIEPLTVTKSGTYNANCIDVSKESKFKEVITAEDFEFFIAKATPSSTSDEAITYKLMSGAMMVTKMVVGDTAAYQLTVKLNPASIYVCNANLLGTDTVAEDGWYTMSGSEIVATEPPTLPALGSDMNVHTGIKASSEEFGVFFDTGVDAYNPVVVEGVLSAPELTLKTNAYEITDTSGMAEKFEIYHDGVLKHTVGKKDETSSYMYSEYGGTPSVGTVISVKAVATTGFSNEETMPEN